MNSPAYDTHWILTIGMTTVVGRRYISNDRTSMVS